MRGCQWRFVLTLLIQLMSISVFGSSPEEDFLHRMKSLLRTNDMEQLEAWCDEIVADSAARNHLREVAMVKLAIDSMNPEALGIFYTHEIGIYDANIDSITPIEYFFDDNFNNRILYSRERESDDFARNLWWMSQILLPFQPLTDDIINTAQYRLKSLKDFGIIKE